MAERSGRQCGFTLLELLAAMGILVFGVTTLIGVLGIGISQRRGAEMRTRAVMVTEQVLHRIETQILARCDSVVVGSITTKTTLPNGDRLIRFKVDDGVIVFPESVKGKQVHAEGTVEVIPMTREQYSGWLRHLAEETGKRFDPESVGEPPYRVVRLRGSGARIAPSP